MEQPEREREMMLENKINGFGTSRKGLIFEL